MIRIEPVAKSELHAAHVESSQIKAYRMFGSLSLNAFEQLRCLVESEHEAPRVLIVDLTCVHSLHESAFEGMIALHKLMGAPRNHLLLCGANHQPVSLMKRGGLEARIGAASFARDLQDGLIRAAALVGIPDDRAPTTAKARWRRRTHIAGATAARSTERAAASSADCVRAELSGAAHRSDLSGGMGD